jgi:hypothetical protein
LTSSASAMIKAPSASNWLSEGIVSYQ